MKSYLRELSFGEILKGCFDVYFHNFFAILVIYALPVFPVTALQSYLVLQEESVLYLISMVPYLLLTTLAYAAITVALSDMCLGNKPSIARSYKFVFGPIIGKLFSTNLLQLLVIMVGLILLIIPGVVFLMWFIFVPIVVVLEHSWGRDALMRSKNLGQGFYLRTFGLGVVLVVFSGIFGVVVAGATTVMSDAYLGSLVINAIQMLVQPLVLIMMVMSYYDLRVRKEAYDTEALAEDLQH